MKMYKKKKDQPYISGLAVIQDKKLIRFIDAYDACIICRHYGLGCPGINENSRKWNHCQSVEDSLRL